jgi:hypothetical protein
MAEVATFSQGRAAEERMARILERIARLAPTFVSEKATNVIRSTQEEM